MMDYGTVVKGIAERHTNVSILIVQPSNNDLHGLLQDYLLIFFTQQCAEALRTTSPLVTKLILKWLAQAYIYHRAPALVHKPKGIGYGIGLAFALFSMQGESDGLFKRRE